MPIRFVGRLEASALKFILILGSRVRMSKKNKINMFVESSVSALAALEVDKKPQ